MLHAETEIQSQFAVHAEVVLHVTGVVVDEIGQSGSGVGRSVVRRTDEEIGQSGASVAGIAGSEVIGGVVKREATGGAVDT